MKPRKKRRVPKRNGQRQRSSRRTPEPLRSPINRRDTQPVPNFSGFLIIRLKPGVAGDDAQRLDEVAERFALRGIATLLKKYNLTSQRLIKSVSVGQLLEREARARDSKFRPRHSLTSYWRLDARERPLEEVLAEFRKVEGEVEIAYLEKSATDPVVKAANDTFAAEQTYLNAAPTGIDARWAWKQPGGDGSDMRFIDLERGWFLGHEDLPNPKLIFNDNAADSGFITSADHGTAVLGVIAGVDNNRGIVGIAPKLSSVRVVSHFEALGSTSGYVADAIMAAVEAQSVPHVLLLEVQRGNPEIPTESDDADFDAIRLAVADGVIVIEAAGNGGINLDNQLGADDSGAILVGAALSAWPHERLPESNFGSRVDCYAWGENIVSAGYGDRYYNQGDNTSYTGAFGGTSGAAAIIAGAALLVQGIYYKATRSRLLPEQMRSILSATGTAQGPATALALENIGIMPDLRQIIQNLSSGGWQVP